MSESEVDSRESFYARLKARRGSSPNSERLGSTRKDALASSPSNSDYFQCKECSSNTVCQYAYQQPGCGMREVLYERKVSAMDLQDPLMNILFELADAQVEYDFEKLANQGRLTSQAKDLKKMIIDGFKYVCDYQARTKTSDDFDFLWAPIAAKAEVIINDGAIEEG